MFRNSPRALLGAVFVLFTVLATAACDQQQDGDQGQKQSAPTQQGTGK